MLVKAVLFGQSGGVKVERPGLVAPLFVRGKSSDEFDVASWLATSPALWPPMPSATKNNRVPRMLKILVDLVRGPHPSNLRQWKSNPKPLC